MRTSVFLFISMFTGMFSLLLGLGISLHASLVPTSVSRSSIIAQRASQVAVWGKGADGERDEYAEDSAEESAETATEDSVSSDELFSAWSNRTFTYAHPPKADRDAPYCNLTKRLEANAKSKQRRRRGFSHRAESPVAPAQLASWLKQCSARASTKDFEGALYDVMNRGCPAPAMEAEEFVCSAKCSLHEPELERSVRRMRMADHSARNVLELCRTGVVPVLIWVSHNGTRFRYANCVKDEDVDISIGKYVWLEATRLMFTASCLTRFSTKNRDYVIGFDWSDFPYPGQATYRTAVPEDLFRYVVPLPGTMRFVGSPAHHGLLFPTNSYVVGAAHCNFRDRDKWWGICTSHARMRRNHPWGARAVAPHWRGAPNGVEWTPREWRHQQRARLVRDYGKIYDVGFVQPPQIYLPGRGQLMSEESLYRNLPRADVDQAKAEWAQKGLITKDENPHYRHILHVDGLTASWGLTHKLLTGSVVIWMHSARAYREHYYEHLQPFVHFVPMAADGSDLPSIVQWLKREEPLVKNIVAQATNLFETKLRAQDTYCYIYRMFLSVEAAQTGPSELGDLIKEVLGPAAVAGFRDFKDATTWRPMAQKRYQEKKRTVR